MGTLFSMVLNPKFGAALSPIFVGTILIE